MKVTERKKERKKKHITLFLDVMLMSECIKHKNIKDKFVDIL